eukprot:6208696-Pleurochrysis_carterae.AAC.2
MNKRLARVGVSAGGSSAGRLMPELPKTATCVADDIQLCRVARPAARCVRDNAAWCVRQIAVRCALKQALRCMGAAALGTSRYIGARAKK